MTTRINKKKTTTTVLPRADLAAIASSVSNALRQRTQRSRRQRQRRPRMMNSKGVTALGGPGTAYLKRHETQSVPGRDLLMDVDADIDGKINAISLNPTSWNGTRVATLASTYQNFRFNKLRLHFMSVVGTTTPGSVTWGVMQSQEFKPDDQTLVASPGGVLTQVYNEVFKDVPVNQIQRLKYFSTIVKDDEQAPWIIVKAQSSTPLVVGKLFVDYVIEFTAPSLSPVKNITRVLPVQDIAALSTGSQGFVTGGDPAALQSFSSALFPSKGIFSSLLDIGKKIITSIDPTGISKIVINGVESLLTGETLTRLDGLDLGDADLPEVTVIAPETAPDPVAGTYAFDILQDDSTTIFSPSWTQIAESTTVSAAVLYQSRLGKFVGIGRDAVTVSGPGTWYRLNITVQIDKGAQVRLGDCNFSWGFLDGLWAPVLDCAYVKRTNYQMYIAIKRYLDEKSLPYPWDQDSSPDPSPGFVVLHEPSSTVTFFSDVTATTVISPMAIAQTGATPLVNGGIVFLPLDGTSQESYRVTPLAANAFPVSGSYAVDSVFVADMVTSTDFYHEGSSVIPRTVLPAIFGYDPIPSPPASPGPMGLLHPSVAGRRTPGPGTLFRSYEPSMPEFAASSAAQTVRRPRCPPTLAQS